MSAEPGAQSPESRARPPTNLVLLYPSAYRLPTVGSEPSAFGLLLAASRSTVFAPEHTERKR